MFSRTLTGVVLASLGGTTLALAAPATKDDAVAMVKSAVALIKAEGPDKAYAEISTPGGKFVKDDLYAYVSSFDGVTLAHPTNPKLIRQEHDGGAGRRRQVLQQRHERDGQEAGLVLV